jgi:hypothetical protein
MPGKGKKGVTKKAAPADDLIPEAMAIISELLDANPDGIERKAVASAAIKAKKAQVATLAFKLTDEQLAEYGYLVDGNTITKAE